MPPPRALGRTSLWFMEPPNRDLAIMEKNKKSKMVVFFITAYVKQNHLQKKPTALFSIVYARRTPTATLHDLINKS